MNADECRRRPLCQGPCFVARSITRLAPAGRAPSTVASERSAVCLVGHACRVGRKQKHEQVIAGCSCGSWRLGGAVRPSFDHIILLVARGRIQSIVALLNPASSYYQAKTEDACIRSGGRRPDSPGGRDRRTARTTRCVVHPRSRTKPGEGCALHRLDAQASQTIRPDGSRGRG